MLFDPSHAPRQMKALVQNVSTNIGAQLRLLRRSLKQMRSKQYQIVFIDGVMDSDQEYEVMSRCFCRIILQYLQMLLVPRIKNHLSGFKLGFLNIFLAPKPALFVTRIVSVTALQIWCEKNVQKTMFDSAFETIRL